MTASPRAMPSTRAAQQSTRPKPLSRFARARPQSRTEALAVSATLLLLVLVGPLFVCMPLCCDVDFYDITARCVLRGELLYNEVMLFAFSGLSLIFAGVRAVLGYSSEALRFSDLLVMGGAAWLLACKLPLGLSRAARAWLLFTLLLFYLGTSEWCHCQPDGWMLLPAAAALCLRCRQVVQMMQGEHAAGLARRGVLEGVCWGIAFTIKPFVALSTLACMALTVFVVCWSGRAGWRRLAADLGGVLLGGLLVGAAGISWLYLSGNWPYFRENARQGPGLKEYYAASFGWHERFEGVLFRLWPWSLVNLAALPLALLALLRAIIGRAATLLQGDPRLLSRTMLAACYLAWFAQANFIQHQLDYHVVAPLMLAVVLVASEEWLIRPRLVRWVVLPVLLLVALYYHPLLQPTRLALWARCWRGSSPQLRERLGSLDKEEATFLPTWPELAAVEQFLKEQGARDGEVICWSNSSLAVYSDLQIQPSYRHVMLMSWLAFMPKRWPAILQEVKSGPRRFIITDLHENLDIPLKQIPSLRRRGFDKVTSRVWPWSQPVIFRAGRYQVHRAG